MEARGPEPVERRADVDLAAIVLASTGERRKHERRMDAPEFVPVDHGRHPERGFDLRSAAVLALVVAILAAIVGWATTIGDTKSTPPLTPKVTTKPSPAAKVAPDAATAGTAKPAPVAGIDLAVGRVIPSRDSSGNGMVIVGIANAGDQAFTARGGGTVLVIVDGAIAASEPLTAIAAGVSARVAVPLTWCPAGTVSMTAVVDPSAVVREADERNNATSRSATFGC